MDEGPTVCHPHHRGPFGLGDSRCQIPHYRSARTSHPIRFPPWTPQVADRHLCPSRGGAFCHQHGHPTFPGTQVIRARKDEVSNETFGRRTKTSTRYERERRSLRVRLGNSEVSGSRVYPTIIARAPGNTVHEGRAKVRMRTQARNETWGYPILRS